MVAIAASIAIITTLGVSMLVNTLVPKANDATLKELGRELDKVKKDQIVTGKEVDKLKHKIPDTPIPFRTAGTGFMIDGKGFLVTNAHIVRNARNIFVINHENDQFRANVIFTDLNKDIAGRESQSGAGLDTARDLDLEPLSIR